MDESAAEDPSWLMKLGSDLPTAGLWDMQEVRTQAHFRQVKLDIPNKAFQRTVAYQRLEFGAEVEPEINLSELM